MRIRGAVMERQCAENVQRLSAEGYRHIRIELTETTVAANERTLTDATRGLPTEMMQDGARYVQGTPKLFAEVRKICGL